MNTNQLAGQTVSRFLIADLEALRNAAQRPDYVMNEAGLSIATDAVRKAFKRQKMQTKGATFDAAVAFVVAA